MANLIQLEAYIGGGGTRHEIWINTDQIISLLPDAKGTRIYLTGPALPTFSPHKSQDWVIDVEQSPKQIRDKVVAERSTRILKS